MASKQNETVENYFFNEMESDFGCPLDILTHVEKRAFDRSYQ